MSRKTPPVRRAARRLAAAAASSALLSLAVALPAAAADGVDLQERVATWDTAAARLGTAGSLWEPVHDLGLDHARRVSVIGDRLAVASGRVTAGDTYAGTRYGRGARAFWISEKWAATGWAAEPAFTTSTAKVGTSTVMLGLPGTRVRVAVTIYANCFPQPADAPPLDVPKGFRCARADVERTGGYLTMTARPSSTRAAPGETSIVIRSTGLSYRELLAVAAGLEQVAGAPAEGAGSAQMIGMCGQMTNARMDFARAAAFAASNGYSARIGSIDGVPQAVTEDYRPDRFTLALARGIVASCTYG
ncbi:MAG: hypothetical protein Q7V58_17680 [Actinomycetota bacterium]|nr:hypothetical protein [Actinomycetota bacterium]